MIGLARQDSDLIQLTPARIALARTIDTTISTSTEITLNAKTNFLRVYAKTKDVYLKWGTDDVTAANFDEVIPAGQIVDLVVPYTDSVQKIRYSAINVIEAEASASIIVIEK